MRAEEVSSTSERGSGKAQPNTNSFCGSFTPHFLADTRNPFTVTVIRRISVFM